MQSEAKLIFCQVITLDLCWCESERMFDIGDVVTQAVLPSVLLKSPIFCDMRYVEVEHPGGM